jgi:hypothetical protein
MLLEPMGYKPKLKNTFSAVMIGYLTNTAIPRLGEVTRCGILSKYEKIPLSKSFGTVIVERSLDLVVFAVLFFFNLIMFYDKLGRYVEDENGNKKYELEENVVSFYEAVSRKNLGLPVIDKTYKASEGWQFLFSMKQNEYFVFPRTEKVEKIDEETGEITEEEIVVFDPNDIDLLNPDNYKLISPNLFRVQKFSKLIYGNSVVREYVFRHHLETSIKNTSSVLKGITWIDFRSSKGLDKIVKVRVNHIGKIVSVGEY